MAWVGPRGYHICKVVIFSVFFATTLGRKLKARGSLALAGSEVIGRGANFPVGDMGCGLIGKLRVGVWAKFCVRAAENGSKAGSVMLQQWRKEGGRGGGKGGKGVGGWATVKAILGQNTNKVVQ